MIVEFLGVSGVGKTTVAKKYRENFENEGKTVIWDTYALYSNYGWFKRNIKKAICIIHFSLHNGKWVGYYYSFLKQEIIKRKDLTKPLFNGIFLKFLLEKAKNDQNIHIFDEGALQYLWAIKMRGDCKISADNIVTIDSIFGLPDYLVSVTSEADTIASRIQLRGEYVRLMDSGNLLNTIKEMQDLQNSIIEALNNKVMIIDYRND